MPRGTQRRFQLAREAQVVLELGNAAGARRAGFLEVMTYVNRDGGRERNRADECKSEGTEDAIENDYQPST